MTSDEIEIEMTVTEMMTGDGETIVEEGMTVTVMTDRRWSSRDNDDEGRKCFRIIEHPPDAKRWCIIHQTQSHNTENCLTFMDYEQDKMKRAEALKHSRDEAPRMEDRSRHDVDTRCFPNVNMIFSGSEARPLKTQYKKLERKVLSATPVVRYMEWWQHAITFGHEDHPTTKLNNRNLPFVVKMPIFQHNVAKTLIDSGSALNLLMKHTFEVMRLP